MAPFRANRATRSGRPGVQADVDIFDGLPIRQWRLHDSLVGPPAVNLPTDVNGAPLIDPSLDPNTRQLPAKLMPEGSELYTSFCQQLLRVARAGRIPKARDANSHVGNISIQRNEKDDQRDNDDDGTANNERQKGFSAKRWAATPRSMEEPEREYLAKRRKGLPSFNQVAIATGAIAPGSGIEAIATSGPGEVTEIRRRGPPPRAKKRGPGRGRKKLVDTAGTGAPSSAGAGALPNDSNATPNGSGPVLSTTDETHDTTMHGDDDEEDDDDEEGDDDGDDDREEGELSPEPGKDASSSHAQSDEPPPPTESTAMEVEKPVDTNPEPTKSEANRVALAPPISAIETDISKDEGKDSEQHLSGDSTIAEDTKTAGSLVESSVAPPPIQDPVPAIPPPTSHSQEVNLPSVTSQPLQSVPGLPEKPPVVADLLESHPSPQPVEIEASISVGDAEGGMKRMDHSAEVSEVETKPAEAGAQETPQQDDADAIAAGSSTAIADADAPAP